MPDAAPSRRPLIFPGRYAATAHRRHGPTPGRRRGPRDDSHKLATTISRLALVRDEAVCIRQWDWSETSQTVSLFGRQSGLVRGIAKGAKREKGRFSGGLEVLSRGEILASIRPGAGLATVTAWDLRETYPILRRSLRAFYCGMYFADLVQNLVSEHDPHPALYDALVAALGALGAPGLTESTLLRFQWAALAEAGYRPELARDVATAGPLADAPTYGFRPREGGISRDPALGGRGPGGPVWRVRGETIHLLRRLSAGEDPAATDASAATVARANRLLAWYVREVLGRQPASMSGVFSPRSRPAPR